MPTRATSSKPAIVQLKIVRRGVDPPIWRRLQVPVGITLSTNEAFELEPLRLS